VGLNMGTSIIEASSPLFSITREASVSTSTLKRQMPS